MKIVGMMLIVLGMSGAVMARTWGPVAVPEINASSGASALTLLSGILLVAKSRWKK